MPRIRLSHFSTIQSHQIIRRNNACQHTVVSMQRPTTNRSSVILREVNGNDWNQAPERFTPIYEACYIGMHLLKLYKLYISGMIFSYKHFPGQTQKLWQHFSHSWSSTAETAIQSSPETMDIYIVTSLEPKQAQGNSIKIWSSSLPIKWRRKWIDQSFSITLQCLLAYRL